jgi:D-alanyl-D-alanine carboxypeptidase
MNKTAAKYYLKDTFFTNPHGLSDIENRSTASDMSRLAYFFMKNQKLKEIVNTKIYDAVILDPNGNKLNYRWINTNFLLDIDGFVGLKTGNTPNAGVCMSISYQKDGFNFILTMLSSKSV